MDDNQNNIKRFSLTTFAFIPFAYSIHDVIYSGKETKKCAAQISHVFRVLVANTDY